MFPSATITIEDSEAEEYANVFGKDVVENEFVLHPPLFGFPEVFNWCMRYFDEPILIYVDDDVVGMRTTITPGSHNIKGPDDILAVIENSVQVICDLDLSVFGYARTTNTMVIDPINAPFYASGDVCVVFGIRGPARHREFDGRFFGRADIDWTLRTLRDDRLVYQDLRYYFDNQRTFAGAGGNVDLFSKKQRKSATELLYRTWGSAAIRKLRPEQKKRATIPITLSAPRRNKNALK